MTHSKKHFSVETSVLKAVVEMVSELNYGRLDAAAPLCLQLVNKYVVNNVGLSQCVMSHLRIVLPEYLIMMKDQTL